MFSRTLDENCSSRCLVAKHHCVFGLIIQLRVLDYECVLRSVNPDLVFATRLQREGALAPDDRLVGLRHFTLKGGSLRLHHVLVLQGPHEQQRLFWNTRMNE